MQKAIKIIKGKTVLSMDCRVTENLYLPEADASNLREIAVGLQGHLESKDVNKPLSLGIFGPPGSGKSYVIKEISKLVGGTVFEFNLSQFYSPLELISSFKAICCPVLKNTKRIVFFDEFDTRFAGSPLGWLQHFLVPMQDGFYVDKGMQYEFGNCVFIFGGGTGSSHKDFIRRHSDYYVNAKGPDFDSRLSDIIDLQGINEPPQYLRRAIVIRSLLNKWSKNGSPEIESDCAEKLLSVARYKHGSRSLTFVLDVLRKNKWKVPDIKKMQKHIDAGPLSGIKVAMSAGGATTNCRGVHMHISEHLLKNGGNLIYGYDPFHNANESKESKDWAQNFISSVEAVIKSRPEDLVVKSVSPVRNLLASGIKKPDTNNNAIEYEQLDSLKDGEIAGVNVRDLENASNLGSYNLQYQQAWSLSLFRMRVQLLQEAHAVIAMAGKEFEFRGRFPGVVEEIILAIALRKPIYILGAFGGAAKAVGAVLGFGNNWQGIPECLTIEGQKNWNTKINWYSEFIDWFQNVGNKFFDLPFCPDLPKSYEELYKYLGKSAYLAENWKSVNGLTIEENRNLFQANSNSDITELICLGLERFFANKT